MILSQRSMMLAMTVCIIAFSGAQVFGPGSPNPNCWKRAVVKYFFISAFYALITVKEYFVYNLHTKLVARKRYSAKPLKIASWVYVVVNGFLGLFLFYWFLIKPAADEGHLCKPSGRAPDASQNAFDYYLLCSHVICFVIAFIARNVPSICSDAKVIYVVSILALCSVGTHIAKFYFADNWRVYYGLRYAFIALDFLVFMISITFLVFSRVRYLKWNKANVVQTFLNVELNLYEFVAHSYRVNRQATVDEHGAKTTAFNYGDETNVGSTYVETILPEIGPDGNVSPMPPPSRRNNGMDRV